MWEPEPRDQNRSQNPGVDAVTSTGHETNSQKTGTGWRSGKAQHSSSRGPAPNIWQVQNVFLIKVIAGAWQLPPGFSPIRRASFPRRASADDAHARASSPTTDTCTYIGPSQTFGSYSYMYLIVPQGDQNRPPTNRDREEQHNDPFCARAPVPTKQERSQRLRSIRIKSAAPPSSACATQHTSTERG